MYYALACICYPMVAHHKFQSVRELKRQKKNIFFNFLNTPDDFYDNAKTQYEYCLYGLEPVCYTLKSIRLSHPKFNGAINIVVM